MRNRASCDLREIGREIGEEIEQREDEVNEGADFEDMVWARAGVRPRAWSSVDLR